MNVIGSRPDGWWRDRDGAARRLLTKLQRLVVELHAEITLVLDGRPIVGLEEGPHERVQVLYARRPGRDAGDDRLVELVTELGSSEDVHVVTSDRALETRVGALGASVTGAGTFLRRLDDLGS